MFFHIVMISTYMAAATVVILVITQLQQQLQLRTIVFLSLHVSIKNFQLSLNDSHI